MNGSRVEVRSARVPDAVGEIESLFEALDLFHIERVCRDDLMSPSLVDRNHTLLDERLTVAGRDQVWCDHAYVEQGRQVGTLRSSV
ncbi:hypothetical protein DEI92_01070 [Curtobacterium sp. MCBD17_034]|nr:hypothetical protein DEI92_01070 [Curtobacterium sp. MCBD17_034]PZM33932.1 hypothetical protein DEI90_09630 [Curtobacterium sp. MCBD17_031]